MATFNSEQVMANGDSGSQLRKRYVKKESFANGTGESCENIKERTKIKTSVMQNEIGNYCM